LLKEKNAKNILYNFFLFMGIQAFLPAVSRPSILKKTNYGNANKIMENKEGLHENFSSNLFISLKDKNPEN